MRYLDLTLPDAAANLALDEALLLQAEEAQDGEVLRVWEWTRHAVILGAGGRLAEETDAAACRADAVPILRRSSGGGTVLLGPGCLLYSLVLAYDRDPALVHIQSSYCYILGHIARCLGGLLPDVSCRGTSDLVSVDRKFSGNAQQRKRRYLLHHGSLLYGFDLSAVARYLRMPPRQPEYRADRSHLDFLCNLPATSADLKGRLVRQWQAVPDDDSCPMTRVNQLIAEKYGQTAWNERR